MPWLSSFWILKWKLKNCQMQTECDVTSESDINHTVHIQYQASFRLQRICRLNTARQTFLVKCQATVLHHFLFSIVRVSNLRPKWQIRNSCAELNYSRSGNIFHLIFFQLWRPGCGRQCVFSNTHHLVHFKYIYYLIHYLSFEWQAGQPIRWKQRWGCQEGM